MNLLHRKEGIILTAIDIMSQLGIQGLTTREIATRQGISEGTIFRHFKNKNEIIIEVMNHFSKFDMDIMDSLKIKDLSFKDAIRYYIISYAEYYHNYPEVVSIIYIYDALINEKELADRIKSIFKVRSEFLEHLVELAKGKGELCRCIDSEGLADIIQGSFRIIICKWRMEEYGFSLKDRVLSTVEMILDNLDD